MTVRPIKSRWHPVLKDNPSHNESPFRWIELPEGLELPPKSSYMTLNEMRQESGNSQVDHPDASDMTHEEMVSKWWKHAIRHDEL